MCQPVECPSAAVPVAPLMPDRRVLLEKGARRSVILPALRQRSEAIEGLGDS
jgi:hypothetical protein